MQTLSIIIPTWNEEGNIVRLVERIDQALTPAKIRYEIIFVDDHSTDATARIIKSLSPRYQVYLYKKKGKRGKAVSLLEGFAYTHYEILCMIDADLQYPPEAIVPMLKKIANGADIVVANRKQKRTSFHRTFFSNTYRTVFVKFLHGIQQDSQSGLKVFRKEVVERIPLGSGRWAIDLALLTHAKQAGYKLNSYNVTLDKRYSGEEKIHLFSASLELALDSLKLRFGRKPLIPFSDEKVKKTGQGFHYRGQAFIHHSDLPTEAMAFRRFSTLQLFIISTIFVDFVLGFISNWHATVEMVLAVLTILYFADLLFNLYLVIRSFSKPAEITVTERDFQKFEMSPAVKHAQSWPAYTVLCPLYKEWQVVEQFVTAMSRLDYPKDRLQVMLLLEEDDYETIEHIRALQLPDYFSMVIVPHSLPKTKPKACNYGLQFATGEYVVIYDAEDVPDPLQLKKAVIAFAKAGKKTICVQAKLNFYNPNQNLLTRVFTAEYSLWFDLVLTGLQSIQAPIPLGGTSNHFRIQDIKTLNGWDSFNVTEDCDLGIRLVKKGYKTAIVDSITLEEANSSIRNWFNQRTRWIKGYMQTYLVHMRRFDEFFTSARKTDAITFQLVVGGKVLSMFINPLMWIITISYFAFRAHIGTFIESFFPTPVLYMGVFSLVVGNFLYMYYYMIGCAKHGHHELVKYVIFVPLYWLAMSIAAWVAFYELLTAPHHWQKTKHGLHLKSKKAIRHASHAIGNELVDETLIHQSVESYPAFIRTETHL